MSSPRSTPHPGDKLPVFANGATETIPLARPTLSDRARTYVDAVLRSARLAQGPWRERFEAQMTAQCGTTHAVATNSGTAALHLVLEALGIGPGDEVITTPFSFVASANVILYVGATPRFVDIDPATLNLDIEHAEAAITPSTRAILAVDVFGLPANWPALTRLADAHDLLLIDDACEALGARIDGRPVGSWAAAAGFGFYPNKQITTGEGGCITTDDDDLARRCRSLRNQGRANDDVMTHTRLGYNYRMSELAAALGCAQLEQLPQRLDQRAAVAHQYHEALAPLADDLLRPPVSQEGAERSWFVYVVRLADHFAASARDKLMRALRGQGIGCAPYFPAIHLQPYYRERFGFTESTFPTCEAAANRTLALPFYPALSAAQINRVAEALTAALPDLPRASH